MNLAKHCLYYTVVVSLFALHYSCAVRADYIVGITSGFAPGSAPTIRINPLTGDYSAINNGGRSYNSLAQDSTGDLFGGWFSTVASNGKINHFDPATGAVLTTYNTATPGAGDIRGLSFDAADNLFAVVNRNDQTGAPTINDDLYAIDLVNESTSVIGSLGFLSVQGLDFSPAGALYAWDIVAGLLLVDPNTGAAVDVNPAVGGTVDIQSIVFAPDGTLYGARENLYSIDVTTGTFAQIGTGIGLDVRGIEWVVPEPVSALHCFSLAICYFACRRRKDG